MRSALPSRRIAALEAEIGQLQAEIKALKRELAGRPAARVTKPTVTKPTVTKPIGNKGGRPPKGDNAMTAAERARRARAKRKAARGEAAG